jgi:hypothetical protein
MAKATKKMTATAGPALSTRLAMRAQSATLLVPQLIVLLHHLPQLIGATFPASCFLHLTRVRRQIAAAAVLISDAAVGHSIEMIRKLPE